MAVREGWEGKPLFQFEFLDVDSERCLVGTCMQSIFSEAPLSSVEVTIKGLGLVRLQTFGKAFFERACQWMGAAHCINQISSVVW